MTTDPRSDFDTYSLPPTQSLVLEVLAARARLGETCWTFSTRHRPALEALTKRGLLWWKSGVVEHTCQAFLTDAGREAVLSADYAPPATVDIEWGVRWAEVDGRDRYAVFRGEQDARDSASPAQGMDLVCRRVTREPWTEPGREDKADVFLRSLLPPEREDEHQ